MMATTRLADVVIDYNQFSDYSTQMAVQKSALIQSGAMVQSAQMATFLQGEGLTLNVRSFKNLADIDDPDNVGNDDPAVNSVPQKIGTSEEIAVRQNRNQSWSSMSLLVDLGMADPLSAIASQIGGYWQARSQRSILSALMGIFADNDAAPVGNEHVAGDLTLDIKGTAVGPTTRFSADAAILAGGLMGDSQTDLSVILAHSAIYNSMVRSNLITFTKLSDQLPNAPTYLGYTVIVDDMMPNPAGVGALQTPAGVYHTYLIGAGALSYAMAPASQNPSYVEYLPSAGNGQGEERIHSKMQWMAHLGGHAYIQSGIPAGGPTNAQSATAANWKRVFPSRKQIKIARLITREA